MPFFHTCFSQDQSASLIDLEFKHSKDMYMSENFVTFLTHLLLLKLLGPASFKAQMKTCTFRSIA